MVVCYTPSMPPFLQADGRFWLTLNGRNFLGRGRVELLRRIRETGSISQAARAMKMSYKAAWDSVAAMNTAWGSPLVDSGPAGSRLTEEAEKLILAWQDAETRYTALMNELTDGLPQMARRLTP